MIGWDEPLDPEDLDELEIDEPTRRPPERDEISEAVGGPWYAANFVVDDCRATYPGSSIVGYSEKFDRYYLHSDVGRLLMDILVGDGDRAAVQARRKHVVFKRAWCADHGYRYLAVTEADCTVAKIRELLADAGTDERPEPEPVRKPRRQRERGRVQRPKATA